MQVSNETLQVSIINLHGEGEKVSGTDTHTETLDVSGVKLTSHNMVVGTHPGEQVPPADVKATSGERAQGLLRGLLLVLQHHEAPKPVMDSFKTQAMAYLDCESEAIFFKRAKYLTVAPMAKYLKCEAPKVPDADFKPVGQYRNWAKTRLSVFCRRNTHLWYSFLQGKRSALPLSDDLVLTTYEEHRKAMEIGDPIDDDMHNSVMKELTPVLNKIRKSLQREYSTAGRDADWLLPGETSHVASTKASYEKGRAAGGQLGTLMRQVPQLYQCNPRNPVQGRQNPDLIRMVFYPRVVVSGRVCFNVVLEEYGYPEGESQWYEAVRKSCVYFAKEQRTLKATIQAVLEPLKVRVISKGNAVPYYASKRLQKALHGVMRHMACFKLIGGPLGATDLFDLAANPVKTGTGQLEWFSIDYSAATDRLSARLSASILSYLTEGQDPAMQNVWRAVLAPHFCEYPFPFDESVQPVQQVNGQLMGSILSFPILCLANLGLYLETIKEDSRPLREKLRGVLVNGDDMLYVAPNSLWEKHIANGLRVGLTMSPGKAYHHPVYANANSACYHFDLKRFKCVNVLNERGREVPTFGRLSSTPYSIPFLNSGLYFGQNKVLGGDDVDNEKSYTSVIDHLVKGALPGKAADLLAMYVSRHSKSLESECAGRNLFVPISLGGMGVSPVEGFEYKVTAAQQIYAQRLVDAEPYATIDQFPWNSDQSWTLPEAPSILRAPWLAGITFEDAGDGKFTVAEKVEKSNTASHILRAGASLLKRTGHARMAPLSRMNIPLRLCSARRRHAVCVAPYQASRNFFEKAAQRDWLTYHIDESQALFSEIAETAPAQEIVATC